MRRDVATIGPGDTLDIASRLMIERGIRHLVVVEEGGVVGVLSERDLLQPAFARSLGYTDRDRNALMKSMRVKDVVHGTLTTTRPDEALSEAASIMVEKRIGCLPVLGPAGLVGIVTSTDLLHYAWAAPTPTQPVAHVPGRRK
jgi:acetoin utilization protein AcuB